MTVLFILTGDGLLLATDRGLYTAKGLSELFDSFNVSIVSMLYGKAKFLLPNYMKIWNHVIGH